ncbi:MAG TPA: hypothetical protein ENK07_09730, partial [Bacteroidetes bacterium]|nr:hypothetical protein [Bacteroidota bacterium]
MRHGIGFDRFPLLPLGLAPRYCRATRAQLNRREVGLAFPGSSFPAGLCGPLRSSPAQGNGSGWPNRFVALPSGVLEFCWRRPSGAYHLVGVETSGPVVEGMTFSDLFSHLTASDPGEIRRDGPDTATNRLEWNMTGWSVSRRALVLSISLLLVVSCTSEKRAQRHGEGASGLNVVSAPISVRDTHFVDAQGRQVLLHGVSVGSKDPERGYLGPETREDFARFRAWGFNCIRFMIFWDGVEPEPGAFDDAYLDSVATRVRWAHQTGLYVLLDMHQDLYSVRFADGAPEWATITDGKPNLNPGAVWSDAYFTSPAVQTALDHFWANSPAPDGVGLQDHYARAWRHVAQRFADEPAVVGYDLMNEPFPGSEAREAQQGLFAAGQKIFAAQAGEQFGPGGDLMQWWLTPEGRSRILALLCNADLYGRLVDAVYPIYRRFEVAKLQPFYEKVAQAIRQVDSTHILFLEPSMASNMGTYSSLEPLKDAAGRRDPLQAYAPHGYDLVTDTPDVTRPCDERVRLIFERHAETARRLGMPMFVGEWGAYGFHAGAEEAAWKVVHVFEQLRCSETYWAYEKNLEQTSYFPALWRPFPERVPG